MSVQLAADLQPVWPQFLKQAICFKTGSADAVAEPTPAFWADSTDFKSPQATDTVPPASSNEPLITAKSKVLILGDSQTVGPYGKTLDQLARATGAQVSTHASWGASPYWFFTG